MSVNITKENNQAVYTKTVDGVLSVIELGIITCTVIGNNLEFFFSDGTKETIISSDVLVEGVQRGNAISTQNYLHENSFLNYNISNGGGGTPPNLRVILPLTDSQKFVTDELRTTAGTSEDVTFQLENALQTAGFNGSILDNIVAPPTGTDAGLVFEESDVYRSKIKQLENGAIVTDEFGREVFGRLTGVPGEYLLSYFVLIDGVETPYSIKDDLNILFSYTYRFEDNIPNSFGLAPVTYVQNSFVLEGVDSNNSDNTTFLEVINATVSGLPLGRYKVTAEATFSVPNNNRRIICEIGVTDGSAINISEINQFRSNGNGILTGLNFHTFLENDFTQDITFTFGFRPQTNGNNIILQKPTLTIKQIA